MATKIEDALDIIKGMTIVELRDLNSAIEEEFGVTAAAPVAVAAPAAAAPAAAGGSETEAPAEEAAAEEEDDAAGFEGLTDLFG